MPMNVEDFINSKLRINIHPADIVAHARAEGDEFADAVSASLKRTTPPRKGAQTMRQVNAKVRHYRQELIEQAGVDVVRIPDKEQRMQEAISALVEHIDDGCKPSALKAATQPGLDERQRAKLAYRTPIMQKVVQSAIDMRPDSAFVGKLLEDAGLSGLVIDRHVNLSKLASVLTKTHRSLAERVQQLEAVVIVLAGQQQALQQRMTNAGLVGNSRGGWHARALVLREQGKTGNQIARLLGKTPNAVEKVLARKGAAPAPQPVDVLH